MGSRTDGGLPPGPWAYEITAPVGAHEGSGHVYLIDATGRKIASIWGPADTKMAIVDMVLSAERAHRKAGADTGESE